MRRARHKSTKNELDLISTVTLTLRWCRDLAAAMSSALLSRSPHRRTPIPESAIPSHSKLRLLTPHPRLTLALDLGLALAGLVTLQPLCLERLRERGVQRRHIPP